MVKKEIDEIMRVHPSFKLCIKNLAKKEEVSMRRITKAIADELKKI